jgi:membrane protein required for colicin V production
MLMQTNPFDVAVIVVAIIAIVTGFNSGLLRSLATIFGYLCAAPVAVTATPPLARLLDTQFHLPPAQLWVVFILVVVVAGMVLSALCRAAVSELTGSEIGIVDRMAGAVLGAVRILLLAVLMVLIFDRIIPAGREPAFLKGSKLQPILLEAGRQGLKTLPPDVAEYIDRLKREHGI